MLKRFTDFTNEKTSIAKPSDSKVIAIPKKEVKSQSIEPKIPKKETPRCQEPKEPKMEKFEFVGKIAKFPGNIKPSVSLVLLENNKVSKEKLHYIISEQTPDTLVVIKYNENAEIKLTEFITILMQYYMKNEQLRQPFSKIVVEGTEHYSIIKNIPNILFGERKLIQVINDDLVKLLK
ncbi:MAG: hypothetical protein HPY57_16055 [Ignavibacteria bacterium]|nr:hypothetical protein [Ignavibacteria bacterium]